MSLAAAGFLVAAAFVTAAISGVFGMAGGLMLKGAIALVLPVSATFVTHGLLQLSANGWRAALHRRHLAWRIVGIHALGSGVAAALMALVVYEPTKATLYLLMGVVPALLWIPRSWLELDASRPLHGFVCGLSVTGLNLTAGVAGPLLDIFFVRTALTRHQIVATKAATQVFAHLAKVVVYGAPLIALHGRGLPPWWVFALAIPLSFAGTAVGGLVLERMDDANFKRLSRLIVSVTGLVYLAWAARLYLSR
ncbi:MAG TPA: sulfite exporter TauE/SafE family protein [Phenylobacterium sp.]|uniref:sulfite exporter TauE/SafE family protein n=1 Tax=Phenylobacterium sp. TaxID=1871053 RepID=UPI002C619AAE|nr:sulfite exporter TauE/SafE family protein [Phenylobacterium sp.]HSV03785.1 sulfite exporter TauE/SafE family protein [Phenylobacterium sp.]